jgi:hypothetical protein
MVLFFSPDYGGELMRFLGDIFGLLLIACGVLFLITGLIFGGSFLPVFSVSALFIAGGWAISNSVSTKTCPACAERVKIKAVKCKHCGSDLANTGNSE